MASLLKDLAPVEFGIIGNTYRLRFEEGKNRVIAVWRLGGAETVKIPCSNGFFRIVERDGESRTVEVKGSILEISVSEKPRYILPAVP
jgi:hypothetical protein